MLIHPSFKGMAWDFNKSTSLILDGALFCIREGLNIYKCNLAPASLTVVPVTTPYSDVIVRSSTEDKVSRRC